LVEMGCWFKRFANERFLVEGLNNEI